MADDKDKGGEKRTYADGKTNKDKMPVENPIIDVQVNPTRGNSGRTEYHRKVRDNLEKDVQDTIDKHKSDGSKKQLDEAAKTVKDAAKKVDPNKVANVKVHVRGTVGNEHVERFVAEPVEKPTKPEEKK